MKKHGFRIERSRGFTLVELMVVTVIIGLLAALSLGAITNAVDQSKRNHAQTTVSQLEMGFLKYYSEYNEWRRGLGEGPFNMTMVRAFWGENPNDLNPHRRQLLQFPQSNLSSAGYLDPWGRPYRYAVDTDYDGAVRRGVETVRQVVLVWSTGPDPSDPGDDLVNWFQFDGVQVAARGSSSRE